MTDAHPHAGEMTRDTLNDIGNHEGIEMANDDIKEKDTVSNLKDVVQHGGINTRTSTRGAISTIGAGVVYAYTWDAATEAYVSKDAKGDRRRKPPAPPNAADFNRRSRWVNRVRGVWGQSRAYFCQCDAHGGGAWAATRSIAIKAKRTPDGAKAMQIEARRVGKGGVLRDVRPGWTDVDADGVALKVRSGKNAGAPAEGIHITGWCHHCATTDTTGN